MLVVNFANVSSKKYTGKWILGRIPEAVFPKIINALLISVGALFIIRG